MDICPFCGVMTQAPHKTQEGCIEALHVEIARMKDVMKYVHSAVVPRPPDDPPDDPDPT